MINLIDLILDLIEETKTGKMSEAQIVEALQKRGISEADARDAINSTPGYW